MARPEKSFQLFRRHGIMGLPRKGTETSSAVGQVLATQISTYPREGMETPVKPLASCHYQTFQLLPVRGRKPLRGLRCRLPPGTIPVRGRKLNRRALVYSGRQYHPRKGAKNSASKKMRSFSFANLNSLFSVGFSSMNGTIAAAVIFSLLWLLRGDKMCYNKANSKHLLQN